MLRILGDVVEIEWGLQTTESYISQAMQILDHQAKDLTSGWARRMSDFLQTGPMREKHVQACNDPQPPHQNVSFRKQLPSHEQDAEGLPDRLFQEYDHRVDKIQDLSSEDGATGNTFSDVFLYKSVLVFGKPSGCTEKIKYWLETDFDLSVLNVKNPTYYTEWLFRYSALADVMIVDRDSFDSATSSFVKFISLARELNDELPIVVISSSFAVNDFLSCWSDEWDFSLKSPVDETSLKIALSSAAFLTVNGR